MNYKSLNEQMDAFEQRFLGAIPFADDLWDEVIASLGLGSDVPKDPLPAQNTRHADGHDLLYDFEDK